MEEEGEEGGEGTLQEQTGGTQTGRADEAESRNRRRRKKEEPACAPAGERSHCSCWGTA